MRFEKEVLGVLEDLLGALAASPEKPDFANKFTREMYGRTLTLQHFIKVAFDLQCATKENLGVLLSSFIFDYERETE